MRRIMLTLTAAVIAATIMAISAMPLLAAPPAKAKNENSALGRDMQSYNRTNDDTGQVVSNDARNVEGQFGSDTKARSGTIHRFQSNTQTGPFQP